MMNERVKTALESIVNRFKEGNGIPEAIAYSTFPIPNIPAAKWSLLNRLMMIFAGTSDARGFRQWKEVGRYVKKGSKSFTILAPRFVRKEPEKEEEEPKSLLIGFWAVPVFKVEDTDGKLLDYQEIELPEFPLIEIAKDWGISVKGIPGNKRYYGYFSQEKREIALATKDESVFFHELSHAAHQRILGELKHGQDWMQEIVSELASCVLSKIVGKTPNKYLGNNYRYIEGYAKSANLTAWQGCMRVISEVDKVLSLIMEWKGRKELGESTKNEGSWIDSKAVELHPNL